MSKSILFLFVWVVMGLSAHAQAFNLKELLTFKDHNNAFFHRQVTQKGYVYDRNRYDEQRERYAYFLPDSTNDLYEIAYDRRGDAATITFGTTNTDDYEQLKKQLDLLEFKFVRYVPKQEHGRAVLMIVYTDGHTQIHLYNSYVEDETHEYVRFYRVKVM